MSIWKNVTEFLHKNIKWAVGQPRSKEKEVETDDDWHEDTVLESKEESENEPERARDKKGQYIGDDDSTPDINEAWKSGKAPVKKGRPKKNV